MSTLPRRGVLSLVGTLAGSVFAGCSGSNDPETAANTSTVTDTPSPDASVVDASAHYWAGPSSPDCPEYTRNSEGEMEVVDHHWGQMSRSQISVETVIETETEALDWAVEKYGSVRLLQGVEVIHWKHEEIEIETAYDAETWFVIDAAPNVTVVLATRDDTTTGEQFWVGDC